MFQVNDNFQKLPGSYLFSTIAKKVNAYQQENPDKSLIRLGIGDVTQPLAPAIIKALHAAVDEMGAAETFHGYAPDLGYEFLRSAIAKNDYESRGCDISADEIFVSDGAKCDSCNIQELFSADCKIAVCDPVYPVYVDSNVMAGRTGVYDAKTEMWSNVIYMPCTMENSFVPEFPKETPDVIYLCLPNNPTGTTITKAQLTGMGRLCKQKWSRSLSMMRLMKHIFQKMMWHIPFMNVKEQETCAIEIRSFSKNAGFTGVQSWIYGRTERSETSGCFPSWYVGKTSRNKIQRCTIYHPACRRSRIFSRRKGTVKRAGCLLYEKCIPSSSQAYRKQAIPYLAA